VRQLTKNYLRIMCRVHDSIDSVKSFFEEHAGPFGATEYFESDRVSCVGLPKG
jgi:hypothetical protein